MPLPHHPSLSSVFSDAQAWMVRARAEGREEALRERLGTWIAADQHTGNAGYLSLQRLASLYGIAACEAYGQAEADALATRLGQAVQARALFLRWHGTYSAMRSDDADNLLLASESALRACAPLMLGDGDLGRICAGRFVEMADKEARLRPEIDRRLDLDTVDGFVLALLSDGVGLAAHPLPTTAEPAYTALIQAWRSEDAEAFALAMSDAADFHWKRSRDSTGSTFYEFNDLFDRVFPGELLAVQAFRRLHALPEIASGHPLIDAPWSVIDGLPPPSPDPLLLDTEAFLRRHLPAFR